MPPVRRRSTDHDGKAHRGDRHRGPRHRRTPTPVRRAIREHSRYRRRFQNGVRPVSFIRRLRQREREARKIDRHRRDQLVARAILPDIHVERPRREGRATQRQRPHRPVSAGANQARQPVKRIRHGKRTVVDEPRPRKRSDRLGRSGVQRQ